jgi:hypothetical protein
MQDASTVLQRLNDDFHATGGNRPIRPISPECRYSNVPSRNRVSRQNPDRPYRY